MFDNPDQIYTHFLEQIYLSQRDRESQGLPPATPAEQQSQLLQQHVLYELIHFHVGQVNGIKNKELRMVLLAKSYMVSVAQITDALDRGLDFEALGWREQISFGTLRDSRPIRDAVNWMRKNKIPVCSNSSAGYWWPLEYREVVVAADELDDRARDILYAKGQLIKGAVELFGQQGRML